MSKFITSIPVDIDALTTHAPKNTYIFSATLSEDRKSVDVIWDNPAFVSPVAGAWPFSIENLRSGKLPDRVKLADWAKKPAGEVPSSVAPVAAPVADAPAKGRRK